MAERRFQSQIPAARFRSCGDAGRTITLFVCLLPRERDTRHYKCLLLTQITIYGKSFALSLE